MHKVGLFALVIINDDGNENTLKHNTMQKYETKILCMQVIAFTG